MNQRRSLVFLALAITVLSAGLNLAAIGFLMPRHYDPSVDGVHPVLSLDAFDHAFSARHVVGHKYPRTHLVLVGGLQRLWLVLRHGVDDGNRRHDDLMTQFTSRPARATSDQRDGLRPFADTIAELIIVARVVSALMGVGVVLALLAFARHLFGTGTAFLAAFLAALSSPLIYYAHTTNVDVPYLFWGMLALVFAVRAIERARSRDIILAAAFVALSGATKDQAFGWFLLTLPFVLWRIARPGALAAQPTRTFPLAAVLVAAATSAGLYGLAIGVPFDMAGVTAHFEHVFGAGVTPYRTFPSTPSGVWSLFLESVLHLDDMTGTTTLVLAAIGIVQLLWTRRSAALLMLVPLLSYGLTFLAPIGYVYMRFLLPVALLLFIPAAAVLVALLRVPLLRYIAVVSVLLLLAVRMQEAVLLVEMLDDDPRARAEAFLEESVDAGAIVAAALSLPMHNVSFPPEVGVVRIDLEKGTAASFPRSPSFYVTGFFDPHRSLAEPSPPPASAPREVPLLGKRYVRVESFAPRHPHPIRRGAAFQPTVGVYRLAE